MHGGREEDERMLLSMVLHNAFEHTWMDAKHGFCRHVRQANNSCPVHGELFTAHLSLMLAIMNSKTEALLQIAANFLLPLPLSIYSYLHAYTQLFSSDSVHYHAIPSTTCFPLPRVRHMHNAHVRHMHNAAPKPGLSGVALQHGLSSLLLPWCSRIDTTT